MALGKSLRYYALIAARIFARKAAWLRSAFLAAALLSPAVTAIYGIVLAAIHVDGAADMELSNSALLTLLLLAGILSLTVEFFRINPKNCTHDDSRNPIPSDVSKFPYGTTCGFVCSIEQGPHSPMRRGLADNIFVIPTPDKLTFDTTTLIAAACCIPAILSLIFMWRKILEINWKTRRKNEEQMNELITGTNDATMKQMKGVNCQIGS